MDVSQIHLAMIALMLLALVGGVLNRWQLGRSTSCRFIQFVGVAWLLGATVILTVASKIAGEVAGALHWNLGRLSVWDAKVRQVDSNLVRATDPFRATPRTLWRDRLRKRSLTSTRLSNWIRISSMIARRVDRT